jgi:hypothetical protein
MYRGKLYAVTGIESRQIWLMKRHFPQPFANFSEWMQRRFFEPKR